MARIICLANSWKHHEHCIAGIDPETGRWIRPVTGDTDDGRVGLCRLVNGQEPELLDILEVPLAVDGPDFGFEPENRLILPGIWRRFGRALVHDILPHVDRRRFLLHNRISSVEENYLNSLPLEQRYTLQLVETHEFQVEHQLSEKTKRAQWRARLVAADGRTLRAAITITDPVFTEKLNRGHVPANRCLVTLGLGLPWCPPDRPMESRSCWKLVAGVIEL